MGLFSQQPRKDEPIAKPGQRVESAPERVSVPPPGSVRSMEDQSMATTRPNLSESVLASGLTIEGKIEGDGDIRIAGRFKGNITVKGELTIEPGASIEGEVNADTVLVGGEVRGQIVAKSRVEFKESGTLIGDVKAGSLTVAAGSRMRGRAEFGWKEGEIEGLPLTEIPPAPVR
jgi:cytoskeletal protein CcmA (bactofilin family)